MCACHAVPLSGPGHVHPCGETGAPDLAIANIERALDGASRMRCSASARNPLSWSVTEPRYVIVSRPKRRRSRARAGIQGRQTVEFASLALDPGLAALAGDTQSSDTVRLWLRRDTGH